jgi:hypothetical protein
MTEPAMTPGGAAPLEESDEASEGGRGRLVVEGAEVVSGTTGWEVAGTTGCKVAGGGKGFSVAGGAGAGPGAGDGPGGAGDGAGGGEGA